MLTVSQITLPEYSRRKVEFICQCGKTVTTTYKVGIKRQNCGECWKATLAVGSKIRMLTLLGDISALNKSDKVSWQCDCGEIKDIAIKSVLNGLTSSCGCKQIRANVGNCDKRRIKHINISDLKYKSFNGIVITDNRTITIHPRSDLKIAAKCHCGREYYPTLGALVRGYSKSCGQCNNVTIQSGTVFGKLTLNQDIIDSSQHSDEKVHCTCLCGNSHAVAIHHLISKRTTSCGRCSNRMDDWWKSKDPIALAGTLSIVDKYQLDYLSQYFIGSSLQPLHGVSSLNEPIKMRCLCCGNDFTTRLSWIYHNKTKSCGCLSYNTSRLSSTLKSAFPQAELEFKVGQYTYDVKIGKCLIECHGLRYHSTALKDSRVIDRCKRRVAIDHDYEYLMFYEDEIVQKDKYDKVIQLIASKIDKHQRIKVRPQSLTFRRISIKESGPFLDTYHYIGRAGATYHFGAYFEDKLIAVMLFSPPSRQNIAGIELSRFCLDSSYSSYGLGSWMLKRSLLYGVSPNIVSYSDNRIHSGSLYEKMGFKKALDVKQDYYWVKNNKRYHKSALRKPKCETKTESEVRSSEGFHKIWDLGKTKWIYSPAV